MGVYGAATGITRHVITVAVRALFNQIGLAQIPMHDAFMNVLFGEGKGQAATGRLAEVDAILAVNFNRLLKVYLSYSACNITLLLLWRSDPPAAAPRPVSRSPVPQW